MTHGQHERRQFGRRTTFLHAWIKIPGRPTMPCIVRNLSVNGALLEFDVPDWMPYSFRLRIEASNFEVDCELRHKGDKGCGVMFVESKTATKGSPEVFDIEAWTGPREPSIKRPGS